MFRKRNRYLVTAATSLLVVGLAGCGGDGSTAGGEAETGNTLERVTEEGIVRVAIANEPPYTKVETDGTVTGADPDVLREVVRGMGIETLEGMVTPFESMIPGLLAGRWDVIAAGLNINPERCAEVLFSEPVIVSTLSFAVEQGNPQGLTTVEDIANTPESLIAVMPGTFEEGVLLDAEVPDGQLSRVKDGRSGVEAVQAGRADAFLTTTLALEGLIGDGTDVEVTEAIPDTPVVGAGVAFRKADSEFHEEYNARLAEFKETPEFAEILTKWGFDPEAQEGVTTEELCNPS